MNLSDLKEAPYNADIREIHWTARSGLSASIREFGDIAGITFNTRTNRLVTGHQRIAQLKNEYGDLEIVRVNSERGEIRLPNNGHIYPVRFVDWPEDKERLANVTANNPEVAGVFTAKLPEFVDKLPAKPELNTHQLAEKIRIPAEFLANTNETAKLSDENNASGSGQSLPDNLPDRLTPKAPSERDGYPVYFMLSKADYQRYRQAAGNDHEAWFLMVLDYAEAGKFKG